jgi:hypothetical protein
MGLAWQQGPLAPRRHVLGADVTESALTPVGFRMFCPDKAPDGRL